MNERLVHHRICKLSQASESLRLIFRSITGSAPSVNGRNECEDNLGQIYSERRPELEHWQNERSHIFKLPNEILIQIFSESLGIDSHSWSFSALTSLATVTKSFATLLRSSCFWPLLSARHSRDLLRAILIRNPDGPLAATVSDGTKAEGLTAFREFAIPQLHRWQFLRYRGRSRASLDVLWRILDEPTPSLTHLDLSALLLRDISISGLGPGPPLIYLRLIDIHCLQWFDRLRGVKDLHLEYSEDTIPELDDLVRMLQGMPELRSLSLELEPPPYLSDRTTSLCEVVHLPKLESIHIDDHLHPDFFASKISSDVCRHLYYCASLDPSILGPNSGTYLCHTLKGVITTLEGIKLIYIHSDYPFLSLIGRSSWRRSSTSNYGAPGDALRIDFSGRGDPSPSMWEPLCLFLKSVVNPKILIYLWVQTQSRSTSPCPGPHLLALVEQFDMFNAIQIGSRDQDLDFLDAYCPPAVNGLSSQLKARCGRLRYLKIHVFRPPIQFASRVTQFIRTVIENRGFSDTVRERGLVVEAPKLFIDLVSAELPAEWFESGRVICRPSAERGLLPLGTLQRAGVHPLAHRHDGLTYGSVNVANSLFIHL